MDALSKRTRRYHSVEFKQQVVDACSQPGASIAAVALAHGINANLARRWLRESGSVSASRSPAVETIDFVPLRLEAPDASSRCIHLELRRGGSQVSVDWPVQAAHELGVWLQAWLR
ncbi:MAG: hypothetical protein H6R26_733 [Proteobacteria bacterium]|nr:hypothetical protein [Pseudomonadota bacterium]